MRERRLRLGVVGLSRGFMLMLPTLRLHPLLDLVAAADPRAEARERFAHEFGARGYDSVEALCADDAVEAVYIATPHQFHAEHARIAAAHGKHMLIEKPMAIDLQECRTMVDAAREAGVVLVLGHSHSFDEPIARTRELIRAGTYGRLGMITALNFTDCLYRPRRPEELDTARGGGVIFSQAAHQIDIVRLLGGGMVASVRAATGNWDAARPTEGAYNAFLQFENGVGANLTYSGYAHFDSDEFTDWIGETGRRKNPDDYGAARRHLAQAQNAEQEAELKQKRAYGQETVAAPTEPPDHEHFGLLIASCEHADIRPMPSRILVYGHERREVLPLEKPAVPRGGVIDELYAAIVHGKAPLHSGEWGLATLEVCTALLRSAAERRDIALRFQVPAI